MIELKDKIVLVTGGGGGIGAAIVRTVVKAGGFAVLHDIKADGSAGALQRELGDKCKLVVGDLADDAAPSRIWAEAVGWKQRVDVQYVAESNFPSPLASGTSNYRRIRVQILVEQTDGRTRTLADVSRVVAYVPGN